MSCGHGKWKLGDECGGLESHIQLVWAIEHPSNSKTCFKVEEIKQKSNLVGEHLNSVFLEEDEARPIVNPTEASSVFLGPKQVRTRANPDIPPAPPPAVPPPLSLH